MRIRFSSLALFFLMLLFLAESCGNKSAQIDTEGADPELLEKSLLEANKVAVKAENEHIEDFLKRRNWTMNETGSGLRYAIYEKGNGEKAAIGKTAVLEYNCRLITGDVIYSSDKDGLKQFKIGQGGVESGLEEGILLLRVGDRAKFVIPSHLGFGLLGDQNKVPPKSTLIYDLKLISLN